MKNRFRVLGFSEAVEQGLLDESEFGYTEDWVGCLFDFKTSPPTLIGMDRMEPEDSSFYRDLAWVPRLLNKVEEEKNEEV
jgi:hypothetical protein